MPATTLSIRAEIDQVRWSQTLEQQIGYCVFQDTFILFLRWNSFCYAFFFFCFSEIRGFPRRAVYSILSRATFYIRHLLLHWDTRYREGEGKLFFRMKNICKVEGKMKSLRLPFLLELFHFISKSILPGASSFPHEDVKIYGFPTVSAWTCHEVYAKVAENSNPVPSRQGQRAKVNTSAGNPNCKTKSSGRSERRGLKLFINSTGKGNYTECKKTRLDSFSRSPIKRQTKMLGYKCLGRQKAGA